MILESLLIPLSNTTQWCQMRTKQEGVGRAAGGNEPPGRWNKAGGIYAAAV